MVRTRAYSDSCTRSYVYCMTASQHCVWSMFSHISLIGTQVPRGIKVIDSQKKYQYSWRMNPLSLFRVYNFMEDNAMHSASLSIDI